MNNKYVLFGLKDNIRYYVENTYPVTWTNNIYDAKIYLGRYQAEYTILREYDTYRLMSKYISEGVIDAIYVMSIGDNWVEGEAERIL